MVFGVAICCKAKVFIREKIRGVFDPRNTQVSLERVAAKLNPKIRGWLNYYSRFGKRVAPNVFIYLNLLIGRTMGRREVPVEKQEGGIGKVSKHCAIEWWFIYSLAERN